MAATAGAILKAARQRSIKIQAGPNQIFPDEPTFKAQTGLNTGPDNAWIADFNTAHAARRAAIGQSNQMIVPNPATGNRSLGNAPLWGAATNVGLLAAYLASLSPDVAGTRAAYREMIDNARSVDDDGNLLAEAFLAFPTKVGGQKIQHLLLNSVQNSSQNLHWVIDTEWG